MRLPEEFYRLPLRFDVQRLSEEVRALPASAWNKHPTDYQGNSSVRLISAGGEENDDISGQMRPTPHLQASPYLQQVLASFGVVWSRSRLMRLAPGANVPEHADINYHWFNRVRVHIPVITRPEVRFHCGSRAVHMAAGEAWIFDNWRRHRVENPTDQERIHLVADTSGSASFWRMVAAGPEAPVRTLAFEPGRPVQVLSEQFAGHRVMPPAEIDVLVRDLQAELRADEPGPAGEQLVLGLRVMLDGFCREWRQLWALHGDADQGRPAYGALIEQLRHHAGVAAKRVSMHTNHVPLMNVLEGRILKHALGPLASADRTPEPRSARAAPPRPAAAAPKLDRPLIIVAAPRSGSTLLYETLACTPQLWNLGGEAHWLAEGIPALRPGAPGVDSNRLEARHCSDEVAQRVRGGLAARLQTASGTPWHGEPAVRLLEKTPKNSLRIPFFDRLFPDARFLFLWRDPRENISSIMEAWRDGGWITYPTLDGWDGPWSLLLPPGWQTLRGRPLEDVAAFQWETTNRLVLADLQALPRERWHAVRYEDLVARSASAIQGVCAFAGIAFDAALAARTGAPLPPSQYTQTPPQPDKWRRNADAIGRVLPGLRPTWDALQQLYSPKR